MNELIFLFHVLTLSFCALGAWFLGKEALIAFVSLCYVLANIFITKQITLLNLHATATDAYIIGSTLGINILNEFYGKQYARKALYISFMSALLFLVLTLIHNSYEPSSYDTTHHHFIAIFSPELRIVCASLFSYYISQTIEYHTYSLLKKIFAQRFLVIRNWITLCFSQAIDTILFSTLALYGIMAHLPTLMAVSYAIKIITIICMSPLLFVIKHLATQYRKHEHL